MRGGGGCPNSKICTGCFVHVILLGVGVLSAFKKKCGVFLSTYNKMDVGCFVRGVFCPTLETTLGRRWYMQRNIIML